MFSMWRTVPAMLLAAAILCGCSKGKAPPSLPTQKADLVLEMFASLEKGDHKAALAKVERLRALEPDNIFLANLEARERNNVILAEVQKCLDEGNMDGAYKALDKGILEVGREPALEDARAELARISEASILLDGVADARNAAELSRNASRLLELSKSYPAAAFTLDFAESKIREASTQVVRERGMAIDDLCREINMGAVRGEADVGLLYALLAVEDPKNPELKKYLEYLEGKRERPSGPQTSPK